MIISLMIINRNRINHHLNINTKGTIGGNRVNQMMMMIMNIDRIEERYEYDNRYDMICMIWYEYDMIWYEYVFRLINGHFLAACTSYQYFSVILLFGSAYMVGAPFFQLAGQTSPCLSVYWNASTNLSTSSTFLPTGRSLTLMCLKIPLSSIMNVPLRATPLLSSSVLLINTP